MPIKKFALLFLVFPMVLSAQKLDQLIDATLDRAVIQYQYMSGQTPPGRYPKTFEHGKFQTSDSDWWCSGFYPGSLLYLHQVRPSPDLLQSAQTALTDLQKEQYNTTTHDLGFMMYCSFGNAHRFSPNPQYAQILMNSAKSLASRFDEKTACIRSWDSAPWNKASDDELIAIIDNMMNLELLFWAAKHSGDNRYYTIATRHADTTMKNHFREDFSSYHLVVYDQATGKAKRRITNQGAADSSAWARGQAWGLYGYVLMYRETRDKKYLEQAQNIANYILNHPNLPSDKIPYWDFNAPNIPNAQRDSSAGAIIASALIELSGYVPKAVSERYKNDAATMLTTLLSPSYIAPEKTNGGFLLLHGVGNMPQNTEVDTPLSYGDYYLIEAMLRYKKILK